MMSDAVYIFFKKTAKLLSMTKMLHNVKPIVGMLKLAC